MQTTEIKKITSRNPLSLLKNINLPARASFVYTAVSVFSRGTAFLLTPVFTRLMSTEGFGAFALFNSYLSLISIIGGLELSGAVLYRLLQKHSCERGRVVMSSFIITLCSGALTLSAFILPLSFRQSPFPGFIPAIIASSLCRIGINIFISASKFKYRLLPVIFVSLAESIISPLLSLLIFFRWGENNSYLSPALRSLSLSCVLILIFASLFIYALRDKNAPLKIGTRALFSDILKTALPMLPYFASLIFISQLDKIIIEANLGATALAQYGVAYSLGTVPTMLLSGILSVLIGWVMRKIAAGKWEVLSDVIMRIFELAAIGAIAFLCICPELFSFMAPREYAPAHLTVYPVAVSSLPLFLAGITTSAGLRYDKPLKSGISGIVALVPSLILNLALIPTVGYVAGGFILLLSYIMLFILSNIIFRKLSGKLLIKVNKALLIMIICFISSLFIYYIEGVLIARLLFLCSTALLALPRIRYAVTFIRETE